MIFLPNKLQRYSAALRNYIQYSVLKNGISPKHFKQLKQIILAEALLSQNNSVPCNLKSLLSSLLLAIRIKRNENKADFHYEIKADVNCILDIKAFTLLILNICSNSNIVRIDRFKGKIIIKAYGKTEKHSRLLTIKLGGCVYREIKTNNSFAVIPFTATDKKVNTVGYKTVTEYISDPFSLVNIFIN